MKTLGMTESVCATCRRMVPAKIKTDAQNVTFEKFCPDHGLTRHLVSSHLEDYLKAQRAVKPALKPLSHEGRADKPCPTGCGFCERHEQHLCMPIVEITSRCDLACPVCIADAGRRWDMTLTQFSLILDRLIQAEKQIDILNLSGGEPLLHPELLHMIDAALACPEIIRVSISTNGLALLKVPTLAQALKQRDVVISLQFDGFSDRTYEILRGQKLLTQKLEILALLAENRIATSLTVTAADPVNTDQFPQIMDMFFASEHMVSMMIQPVSFAGRGSTLRDSLNRLTIPDVIGILDSMGHPRMRGADFQPLPCSHPLCLSVAYYLLLDENSVSLNQLINASQMMKSLANRTVFGLDSQDTDTVKDLIYDIWSSPNHQDCDTETVLKVLRQILDQMSCACFDARKVLSVAERHVKSIFIHAFQDAETFDLSRVRRCCQAYPQPDGRLIPACVHNVLGGRDTPPSSWREQS
jgi:uncharacterized radical SAM superfamily Fe-S cluster-containing enzyme